MHRILKPLFFLLFTLTACTPGAEYTLPPGVTLEPGTDIPQQVATIVASALTQTALPPTVTSFPMPSTSIPATLAGGLKPADSDIPAAGICDGVQGDPVTIVLGLDGSGIPLAGRCIVVDPAQRIKLINQSNGTFGIKFAEYYINLPIGGEMLLDKPAGEYLALGVHFLPMGPELWVKATAPIPTFTPIPLPSPFVTAPPPPITVTVPPSTCDKVQYVADVTIPDGTIMQPGAQFTKTWRLKNVGTCTWKKDTYQLVYISGSTMGSTPAVFPQDVPVGQTYDFSINLIAPSEAGSYRGYWMFKNASGTLFGVGTQGNKPWWVDIKVAGPSVTTYEATMADNGKTFLMNVGDKLKINLDLSYGWSATSISNPAVIAGAQDGYFALASGSATLSITGNPECLNSTPPCGMPSIIYTITVIVQ